MLTALTQPAPAVQRHQNLLEAVAEYVKANPTPRSRSARALVQAFEEKHMMIGMEQRPMPWKLIWFQESAGFWVLRCVHWNGTEWI